MAIKLDRCSNILVKLPGRPCCGRLGEKRGGSAATEQQ
jgi:hypothetical protein